MKEYTLGFCTTPTGHVLLALKDGKGPDGDGWNGVGGKLEPGEAPEQGMAREWMEETGLPPVHWSPHGTFGTWGYRVYVFSAVMPHTHRTFDLGGDIVTEWAPIADVLGRKLGTRRMVSWGAVALAMALEKPSPHDGSGHHLHLRF